MTKQERIQTTRMGLRQRDRKCKREKGRSKESLKEKKPQQIALPKGKEKEEKE